jgi:hypothetical protein
VVKYAKERECIAIKLTMAGPMGSQGWPDYLFIGPQGDVFFIEFKKDGGKPTPLQLQRHKELADRGHAVYVVDDVGRGKRVVDMETW